MLFVGRGGKGLSGEISLLGVAVSNLVLFSVRVLSNVCQCYGVLIEGEEVEGGGGHMRSGCRYDNGEQTECVKRIAEIKCDLFSHYYPLSTYAGEACYKHADSCWRMTRFTHVNSTVSRPPYNGYQPSRYPLAKIHLTPFSVWP
jgi:hypothetical protein